MWDILVFWDSFNEYLLSMEIVPGMDVGIMDIVIGEIDAILNFMNLASYSER